MAEVSSDGVQDANIVNCPVCSDLAKDAKLHPCGSSWQLDCPRCNSSFSIPSGGLQNLPQNVYVDDLFQLKMSMSDQTCSGDERDPAPDAQGIEHSSIRTYGAYF